MAQDEMQRASFKQELDRMDLELAHLKHYEQKNSEREEKLKADILNDLNAMLISPRARLQSFKSPTVSTPKKKSKIRKEPKSRQTNETPTSR